MIVEDKVSSQVLTDQNLKGFLENPNKLQYRGYQLFAEGDALYAVHDDGFIYSVFLIDEFYLEGGIIEMDEYFECPMLVGYYDGECMLLNADEGDRLEAVEYFEENPNVVRFSFNCVGELVGKGYLDDLFKTLDVIDYTADEYKKLTVRDKGYARKMKYELLKPPVGFNLTWGRDNEPVWHKPSTILLYDSETKKTYLLGVDEDQYFGCELAGKPKTVEDALVDLQPKEVRGKVFNRQGEWFFVYPDEEEISKLEKLPVYEEVSFHLPYGEGQNPHAIEASEMCIINGKVFLKNPYVSHDQHAELGINGWVKFYENTAKRSVSVDGVD